MTGTVGWGGAHEVGHERPRSGRPAWLVPGVLGAAAIGLGYVGFAEHCAALGQERSSLDLFYLVLQLFVFESGSVTGPVGWELEIARFLAPAVTAFAAAKALALVFREQADLLRARGLRDHVVVCGLGRKGARLVRDFLAHGDRVVAIEADPASEEVGPCREAGAVVLAGSATDPKVLERARLDRAALLVATCGADGTNVEVAIRAHDLLAANRQASRAGALACHLHVVDLALYGLLRRHALFHDPRGILRVQVFNLYENVARLLLESHPLERDLAGPSDPRQAHLVVIGLGRMGQSLVLQAVRVGHFANGTPLRITVIDRFAEERGRDLLGRYAQLARACEITFLRGQAQEADVRAKVSEWAGDPGTLLTVAVCLDDDARALACALALLPALQGRGVPLFVRMSSEAGLATLLRAGGGDEAAEKGACAPRTFGVLERACTRELVLGESLDRMARAVHADYVEQRRREGKSRETDPALAPWEDLDVDLRESNREQADHISIKLRSIRCRAVHGRGPGSDESPFRFTQEEIEQMARMEHSRWSASRRLAGWTLGPVKDLSKRTNPALVPWEDLSNELREYDRQAVRQIPALLALAGMRIERDAAGLTPP